MNIISILVNYHRNISSTYVRTVNSVSLTSWYLSHWGRVTNICVGKLTIIDSDNGLLPGRRQAIIWTNVGILLIGPLGTNFNDILIGIELFSFKKIHLKMSSTEWRPFCLGLNVITGICHWRCSLLQYYFLIMNRIKFVKVSNGF